MRTTIAFGLLLVSILTAAAAGEARPVATPRITNPLVPTATQDNARKARPFSGEAEAPTVVIVPATPPPDSGWTLIDSLTLHRMVPAGERLGVLFDAGTESLHDTLLPVFLTSLAEQAVALAPTWLQDDLADALRRTDTITQNRLADQVIFCPDKRYYDEVCFQIAHLSPGIWISFPFDLLVDNVQLAYEISPQLPYVDIVDYGNPLHGGDYYSTTRYRAVVEGDTVLVEIPREVYYWWVIMPKVTDEPPAYVYGYFWREYLFYHNDSGYPLLQEKLANTTLLWNGERRRWVNRNEPYPDTLPAVGVVSRWVAHTLPYPASGNRPIQPNTIAHEHDGNCGEVQDLLCAAARTALIPCAGVMDINEDHVWCEIWWQGEFYPWQVDLGGGVTNIKNPGIAYDRKYGGGKEVSGVWDWRNDGLQRSVVGTYSDVCTLTVEVRDARSRLVDGAVVRLQSEGWQTSEIYNCFFGVTDRSGRYTTTLGDWQNYYLSITSDLGSHGAGRTIDSADAAPGTHFFYACTLENSLDSLEVSGDSGTQQQRYRLDVSYDCPREAVYGYDCWNAGGANTYALVNVPGFIDFLLLDQASFDLYASGQPFNAFASHEDLPTGTCSHVLTSEENHYAVLTNQEKSNLTVFADLTVKLYKTGVGIAERSSSPIPRLQIGPSPFTDVLRIGLGPRVPSGLRVEVLDRSGRVVGVPDAGGEKPGVLTWNGTDLQGRRVPSGVYFIRASHSGSTRTRPVVFLGGAR